MLRTEVEERAGPDQGDCGQMRYLPLILVYRVVGSGVCSGCVWESGGGLGGTELGQLCRAPYVPVHSTMGNLRVYPVLPLPQHREAERVERGPGREEITGPRLVVLSSQLGKV